MKELLFIVLFICLAALTACGGQTIAPEATVAPATAAPATAKPAATEAPTATAEPTAEAIAACPTATDDTYLLRDPRHGFCLLYVVTAKDECLFPKTNEQLIQSHALGFCFLDPTGFTFEEPSEINANLFLGSMMDVEHPKLMIEVTDAAGATAATAADELVASFEGFDIPRTFGDTLGYEVAERLDNVPGQDLGRVLLVVHGGRLYRLTFVPNDPTQGDVYNQMEALFAQVLRSFRFLP